MTTILFVPGAWITPAFYQPFIHALSHASYDVQYAGYPSLDPEEPLTATCQVDSDAVTDILQSLVEDEGKDVVVFMHSYGGMPGSAAASGLSKVQRVQEGKTGGVIGLLYLGAFVVPEGHSCAGLQGGALPPWILLDQVRGQFQNYHLKDSRFTNLLQPYPNVNVVDDPVKNFAADVNHGLVKKLTKSVKPHSNIAFTSTQPHPAWADQEFEGRLGFIVTTEDAAVPKEAQTGMMAATQKAWIVKEIASSHCAPFINRINETVGLIREIIDQFL
jgi:pimeloyl-ACP methyl ester carboxylesterase